jgi:NAD(P)-dependent dehydrogenase (short-subunit alcohol dehydrogenase family)
MSGRYEIAGRTVLITGAARGIGAATAERLHARGANVALVGLEPELLEALAARLGERAIALEADVTDAGALERAVDATVRRFGGIDVAIANAGIHFVGALASAPVEQVERTLEVNLLGVWRTDRAVLPQLLERRGYLLNIASLAAASHAPMMAPYAAAKAGVEALSDSLRVELAGSGARVGCAYFGFIDTDLVRRAMSHPSSQALHRLLPPLARKVIPVSAAAAAIERGVVRRRARVWAPRFAGPALLARGLLQPLTEWRAMRSGELAEALRIAEADAEALARQDPVLGVAATEGEGDREPARAPAAGS